MDCQFATQRKASLADANGHQHKRENDRKMGMALRTASTVFGVSILLIPVMLWLHESFPKGKLFDEKVTMSYNQTRMPHAHSTISYSQGHQNSSFLPINKEAATASFRQADLIKEQSCSVQPYFNDVVKPAMMKLAEISKNGSVNMVWRHNIARFSDKIRPMMPGNLHGRCTDPPNDTTTALQDFLLSPSRRKWADKLCVERHNEEVSRVDTMARLPVVNDPHIMLQRSFGMHNVGYTEDIENEIFPDYGSILKEPYCDLRQCDQKAYPFIYFVIVHRNRVANILRLVQSVRESIFQCNRIPKWANCLCIYISDYDTKEGKIPFSKALHRVYKGHVRLLSRRNVRETFKKGQIYNAALRYIPTPANRSLVYFMDADLVMVDTSVVDRALNDVRLGESVMFPSIKWGRNQISDTTTLYERLFDATIWEKKFVKRWDRSTGMVAFYLFDNPLGYWGSLLFKEVWGGEDTEHFYQYKALEGKQELDVLWPDEPYLWHMYHRHAKDWKKSADGIN